MLKCRLCEYQNEVMIPVSHIKKHGITFREYKEMFPDAIVRIFSKEQREKISKANRGKKPHNAGKALSKEHREKISNSNKNNYSSGDIVHWNTGKHLSDETKKKISDANKGKKLTPKQKENQKSGLAEYKNSDRYNPGMLGKHLSSETKEKISKAKLGEKNHTFKKMDEIIKFKCVNENLTLISYEKTFVNLQCDICDTKFRYTKQMFNQSSDKQNKYCPTCNPSNCGKSLGEKDLLAFIRSIYFGDIIENDRKILGGKEIDILLSELKIGFEYTGLYWHSENNGYHKNHLLWKKQFAYNKGIRLITIFEDEWLLNKDIVRSRIMNILNVQKQKIYARKCSIETINSNDKNVFLSENHIQGKDTSSISLGLKYNGDLVAIMTFKKTNMSKGGDGKYWELSRFCSKLNTNIVGGASKLLTHFIKNYSNNIGIISYADARWSDGNLYEKLGFKFHSFTPPSYWYMENYRNRLHRSNFMKHKILQKYKIENDEKTEWEIMKDLGFDRIWDCGTTKWILDLN